MMDLSMIQSLYPDGVRRSQVQAVQWDLFVSVVSYGTANERIVRAYVSRSPEVPAVVETRGMTYIVQERYRGSASLIFSPASELSTKSTSLYFFDVAPFEYWGS